MIEFKGKTVMVFSPYGATKHYGQAIIAELRKRGAVVYDYDERPSQKQLMKIIIRLFKKKIPAIFDKYIGRIIKKHAGEKIDYILICRGEAFTPYTINHLREAFPGVKVLLYLWDVMHECAMNDVVPACDKAMSFDPEDAIKNGLGFRPTFYVNDYLEVKEIGDNSHDLCFVGTLYSPRHLLIKRLMKTFAEQGLDFFTYLYVPGILMYIKESIVNFPFMSIRKVQFKPLTIPDTIQMLNNCKCILDLNPPYQTSLSTRAHEAMAARRKYVTTNAAIKDYEYYNPNNILIIDIENPIIPKEFLNSPYEAPDKDVLYKYSVGGLVDDLFNEC